jgi:hypothetical protein
VATRNPKGGIPKSGASKGAPKNPAGTWPKSYGKTKKSGNSKVKK